MRIKIIFIEPPNNYSGLQFFTEVYNKGIKISTISHSNPFILEYSKIKDVPKSIIDKIKKESKEIFYSH